MARFLLTLFVSACFIAGICGVPAGNSDKTNTDENLDTAAQGYVGYVPSLYDSALVGPGYSQVISTTSQRVVRPGYSNLGYGYNNLGYGNRGHGYGGYPYGLGYGNLGGYGHH